MLVPKEKRQWRLEDVGITPVLTAECGYETRVLVEDLSNFGDEP